MTDSRPGIAAEEKDGEIILTVKGDQSITAIPLSVGDAFTLATQLTAAQEKAIAWQAEHGQIIQVEV